MIGGRARAYTPKKSADYEKQIAAACNVEAPLEGPLSMVIKIYLPIPASWSKKKQQQARDREIFPTSRPDIDNYAKAVLDALNGIAYEDDSQVIDLIVEKRYARDEPGVLVVLETFG